MRNRLSTKVAIIGYLIVTIATLVGSILSTFLISIFSPSIKFTLSYLKFQDITKFILDLPFPAGLIYIPITEIMILSSILLLTKLLDLSFRKLGLNKIGFRIIMLISIGALLLFFTNVIILMLETRLIGPDLGAEFYSKYTTPKSFSQLIFFIIIQLILVGPSEELAFRGFIQKGFENSWGKTKSLLITSILFGLWHAPNRPYHILTSFIGGLVLGYTWQRTNGNTLASAFLHGFYNSLFFTAQYLGYLY